MALHNTDFTKDVDFHYATNPLYRAKPKSLIDDNQRSCGGVGRPEESFLSTPPSFLDELLGT